MSTFFDHDDDPADEDQPVDTNAPPPEYWAARAKLKQAIADRKGKRR